MQAALAQVWSRRDDRYSELRGFDGAGLLQAVRKPEMFAIGG
ncbi:hypothetical protein THICB3640036 [Thiomonas sp. CB3]|nr:hypothetical protein THICB3640036 [Thiomonas sp. CB3]